MSSTVFHAFWVTIYLFLELDRILTSIKYLSRAVSFKESLTHVFEITNRIRLMFLGTPVFLKRDFKNVKPQKLMVWEIAL